MKRRRSSAVPLVLMGTAVILVGCDDNPQSQDEMISMFSDVQSCASVYSEAECKQAEEDAVQEHLKSAPRFATLDECVAEFGKDACVPSSEVQKKIVKTETITEVAPDGSVVQVQKPVQQPTQASSGGSGDFFMPFMLGYMLSDGLNSVGRHASAPVYYGAGQYRLPPDRREVYVSGGRYSGQKLGYVSNNTTTNRATIVAPKSSPVAKAYAPSVTSRTTTVNRSVTVTAPKSAPSARGIAGSTGRSASVSS